MYTNPEEIAKIKCMFSDNDNGHSPVSHLETLTVFNKTGTSRYLRSIGHIQLGKTKIKGSDLILCPDYIVSFFYYKQKHVI